MIDIGLVETRYRHRTSPGTPSYFSDWSDKTARSNIIRSRYGYRGVAVSPSRTIPCQVAPALIVRTLTPAVVVLIKHISCLISSLSTSHCLLSAPNLGVFTFQQEKKRHHHHQQQHCYQTHFFGSTTVSISCFVYFVFVLLHGNRVICFAGYCLLISFLWSKLVSLYYRLM